MADSVSKRSLQWLRDHGYTAQVVEQNVRYPDKAHPGKTIMFKRDLWGFADIAAVHPDMIGTVYVQSTLGMNNKGERMKKIETSPLAPIVLFGNRVELHIWRKMGARGKRKVWKLARYEAIWNKYLKAMEWKTFDDDIDWEETPCLPSETNLPEPSLFSENK